MVRLRPDLGEDVIDPSTLDTVSSLIQARIDGRISRRGLLRRAAQIGIAAPVVGVMLHATSDMAFGAPSHGRALTLRALRQGGSTVAVDGPTAPEGARQEGGTIVCGTNEEPDTLHPWLSQLVTGADVFTSIVEGLMAYDSNQQLIPALAESVEISDDGLTYTFTLRAGVTFHDGAEFTSQDVLDSWTMNMDPAFGSFSTLGWDQITDMTAPDPLTVVMITGEPYAPFLSYVGTTPICPSSAMAQGVDAFKQQYGRAPIGTGPMKFVEWRAKEQITLAANDDYWGGRPILDSVIYRVTPDDNTLLVQLRTGEVQLASSSGAISATRVDEALGFEDVVVYEHPTLAWNHLDLKHVDHLRKTKVRQALDFATPSQQIIDQLLKGRATPSVADQAPGTWAFNPDLEPRPYDLAQAEALLVEAGLTRNSAGIWEGPVPAADVDDPNTEPSTGEVKPLAIEIWGLAGDTTSQQICQVIAASWSQLGVKAEAKFEDVSTIWGPEGYQFTDAMTACLYSWFNANDPDDMFYWHSSQIPDSPTGSGGNLPAYFFRYNFQDRIDELTEAGAKETDQDKRQEIYFEVQQLLHEEVPVIFIYWNNAYPVAAKNIGGFWPSAFNWLLWNVEDWYLTA
jgi:peptide/nickel transport system substrate-binding protein